MIKFLPLIFLLFFIGCGNNNAPQNRAPIAKITASPQSITVGNTITLDANNSSDSDGQIVSYQWLDQNNQLLENSSKLIWQAPSTMGTYTITLKVTDDDGATATNAIRLQVNDVNVTPPTPFSAIQNLIASGNAIYICVGDSTRAGPLSPYDNPPSPYDGEHLFDTLKSALDDYNVTSYLYAKAGQEAKQFNLETQSPTWSDVTAIIPNDGATSIVDISLGINDLFSEANKYSGTVANIKSDLVSAINKIKAQKPQTHFLLTMPNPKDPAADSAIEQSNTLKTVYRELSDELHLPLIDTQGELNFTHDMFQQKDTVHYHMTPVEQVTVANLIKSKILPQ